MQEYALDQDPDGDWYIIRSDDRPKWVEWINMDPGDEAFDPEPPCPCVAFKGSLAFDDYFYRAGAFVMLK